MRNNFRTLLLSILSGMIVALFIVIAKDTFPLSAIFNSLWQNISWVLLVLAILIFGTIGLRWFGLYLTKRDLESCLVQVFPEVEHSTITAYRVRLMNSVNHVHLYEIMKTCETNPDGGRNQFLHLMK